MDVQAMDIQAVKFIAAAAVMIGGALAAGLGLGWVFSTWLSGVARNPGAEGLLRQVGMIAFAGTELILLMSLVVVALFLFVV